ncbi:MAG: LuxR C-terminal-related transcriptional regulator [Crocinitomicaceae bacterium]|nr:LuxR C-terminal-related transcriptional regulator [Crocinitomicaceae bacterium]
MKYSKYHTILTFILAVLVICSSCSDITKPQLEYSFEAAINPKQSINEFKTVNFAPFEDLNLGFFKGDIWIKLEVQNSPFPANFMVINHDLINRNYEFYKIDSTNNKLNAVKLIKDFSRKDARSFNFPNPNFELKLNPNEKATYLIKTYSDGRAIDATPQILNLNDYGAFINSNASWSIVFLVLIVLLLAVNVYQWNFLKRKIYFYYIFYMISTFIMYFGLEGHLYNFGLKHHIVDHLVFISIRIWVLSLLIYTSNFLETKVTAPRFYKFLMFLLISVLGGTTLYQFIFFNTSIAKLHFFENTLSFAWILLILTMIILSAKKRHIELKYYLIPLLCFLLFTAIGLIDGHFQILPGDPFFYIKSGTLIEFIGFTYFIARLIRSKLSTAEKLELELAQNEEKLSFAAQRLEQSQTIEKTDIIGIFKLLEHTLSDQTEWEEFKTKFGQLNTDFLKNLTTEHAKLSKSEIRLLTLIKIGYTQKEIASMLNIEPNSVKKAKNRVRKKLNIPSSETLPEFLSHY